MPATMRRLAIVVCALAATGCGYLDNLLAPAHPETTNWVKFDPPGWYRTLFVEAEQCSGLERNYQSLRFYYHVQKDTSDHILDSDGQPVLAMEDAWSRRVWIGSQSLADPMVVEHEMMHYLLDGVGGHPPKYFEDKCHLRPWVYTQADWTRDHNMMSAFAETNGSLDLPVLPDGQPEHNGAVTGSDSSDVGVPQGAEPQGAD